MADLQAQIKGDIAKIQADVSSVHDHLVDLKSWMAAHLIVIVPVCLGIGWVFGKSF